jgi:hypothetical protein
MTPIYHQFHRDYPGELAIPGGATGIYSTPYWPSHTDQIGVYHLLCPLDLYGLRGMIPGIPVLTPGTAPRMPRREVRVDRHDVASLG